MNVTLLAVLVALSMAAATILALEIGRRFGARRGVKGETEALVALEGAVYGLMGLLIGFTFATSAGRFDHRLDLFSQEANAIETAYLRTDIVEPGHQARLREDLRHYLNARVDVFELLPDVAASDRSAAQARSLQTDLWQDAVTATQHSSPADRALVLSSMNEAFDTASTRDVFFNTHPDRSIFILLGVAIVGSAVLAGYGMGVKQTRSWLHVLSFVLLTTAAVFVILAIEFPRTGFIRVDAQEEALVELQMKMAP